MFAISVLRIKGLSFSVVPVLPYYTDIWTVFSESFGRRIKKLDMFCWLIWEWVKKHRSTLGGALKMSDREILNGSELFKTGKWKCLRVWTLSHQLWTVYVSAHHTYLLKQVLYVCKNCKNPFICVATLCLVSSLTATTSLLVLLCLLATISLLLMLIIAKWHSWETVIKEQKLLFLWACFYASTVLESGFP